MFHYGIPMQVLDYPTPQLTKRIEFKIEQSHRDCVVCSTGSAFGLIASVDRVVNY